jgi:hypothetical protein
METEFTIYIYPVLKTILGTLITIGLSYVVRKYRLDFLIGKEEIFKQKILERMFHWEEKDKQLKSEGEIGIGGNVKFDKVVDWVLKQNPKLSVEEAIEKVEDVIGMCPQLGAFTEFKSIPSNILESSKSNDVHC